MYLYQNQITDISSFSGLTKLSILYLSYNQITDISSLAGLTNLYSLSLDNNQITDISSLAGLTNLQNLYLYQNQITDISSLAVLTNLKTLNLNNNQISDISSLSSLMNLTYLDLENNQICGLLPSSFINLKLNRFYITNNKLKNKESDYTPEMWKRITKYGGLWIQDPKECGNNVKLYGCNINNQCVEDPKGLFTGSNCNNTCNPAPTYSCSKLWKCMLDPTGKWNFKTSNCDNKCSATADDWGPVLWWD